MLQNRGAGPGEAAPVRRQGQRRRPLRAIAPRRGLRIASGSLPPEDLVHRITKVLGLILLAAACGDDADLDDVWSDAGSGGGNGGARAGAGGRNGAGMGGRAGGSSGRAGGSALAGTSGQVGGGMAGEAGAAGQAGTGGDSGGAPPTGGTSGTGGTAGTFGGTAATGNMGGPGGAGDGGGGSSGAGPGGEGGGGVGGSGATGGMPDEPGGSGGAGGAPGCELGEQLECASQTAVLRCGASGPETRACEEVCLNAGLTPGDCSTAEGACACGEAVDAECWRGVAAVCFCLGECDEQEFEDEVEACTTNREAACLAPFVQYDEQGARTVDCEAAVSECLL